VLVSFSSLGVRITTSASRLWKHSTIHMSIVAEHFRVYFFLGAAAVGPFINYNVIM
jgi:hypothetical protein